MGIKRKKFKVVQSLKDASIALKLKDHNVSRIVVEFSGGGDDGGIDDVQYYLDKEEFNCLNKDPLAGNSNSDDFFYRMIDQQTQYTGDWVNNDGGWGTLTINLEDNVYEVECNFRTSEHHQWDPEPFF